MTGYVIDSIGCAKWYEYKENMILISKQYPTLKFQLYGHGEEHFDVWKHYFYNGKEFLIEAQITFPDFSFESLK